MFNWMSRAACRTEGTDPELFFPLTERGPGAVQVADAKAVCARCPVREACLTYALDGALTDGVYGGRAASERRRMRRGRPRRAA